MADNKHKHLDYIQSTITRMATNSFMIKGWSITLVSALLALSANSNDKRFILVAYYPIIMFWILDSYFLWQERLYRALYNKVIEKSEEKIDFSMDTTNLKTDITFHKAFFSPTLLIFYLIITGAVLLALILGNFIKIA